MLGKRRSNRQPITLEAGFRGPSGDERHIIVIDLSAEGCRIDRNGFRLFVGQHLLLRPEAFEPIRATVRWITPAHAGLEFDRPLYGPVVQHLQREFAPTWYALSA